MSADAAVRALKARRAAVATYHDLASIHESDARDLEDAGRPMHARLERRAAQRCRNAARMEAEG